MPDNVEEELLYPMTVLIVMMHPARDHPVPLCDGDKAQLETPNFWTTVPRILSHHGDSRIMGASLA